MFGGQKLFKPVFFIRRLPGPVRKQLFGKTRQLRTEWKQEQGGYKIEQCMYVGNLGSRIAWGEGCHPAGKGNHDTDNGKYSGAYDIKHQVDQGGAFCIPVRADGGQHGRDAGADVLAEQNKDSAVDSNQPADSQGLQDSDRCG